MFSVRLTVYATVLLAVAAVVFSYNAIDRWKNFKEVTAVIDDVDHKCHRDGTTLGDFSKAEPQALRACKNAELTAAKGTPHRAAIARTFLVRYVSPVDQREHQGSIRVIGFPEDLMPIPADGRLPILAHLSKPDVIKPVEHL
jgi:hypothetical protein